MMRARRYPILAMLLVGCTPSGKSIGAQMDAHSEELRTRAMVSEALNKPQGPDYAAAVKVVERSRHGPLQIDYDIGNLLLASCRDGTAFCTGTKTAQDGLARLYHVATTPGEDAEIAVGDIALWFTRGAGAALRPDPKQATCWTRVHDGKARTAECPLP